MTIHPRTLEQMHRRTTRYEVVAVLPTGTMRVGFTARPSKWEFLKMAQQHSAEILPYVTMQDYLRYTTKEGLRLSPSAVIRKSGKTERDCAMEILAHPWVKSETFAFTPR